MTFFGADPSFSHFAVSVRYQLKAEDGTREAHRAQRERRESERATLKAAGIKTTTYFQYRNSDKAGKAKAERLAKAEAKRIEKLTGVPMETAEGCFL